MQHPTTRPDSPFNLLINDLAAMRDARTIRDNARAARLATEAARNRRSAHVQQQQQAQRRAAAPRRLAKAAPPAPVAAPKPPDWQAIAAQQATLEKAMRDTAARATQNAVRDRLADLGADAKAGRLDAHSAALLDVYRGRAAALGLQP